MSGTNPLLTPGGIRKQLLIAESEINRGSLLEEITVLRTGCRTFAGRAKWFGAAVVSAASLVRLWAPAKGRGPAVAVARSKTSWLSLLLRGATVIATLWLAPRKPGRDR